MKEYDLEKSAPKCGIQAALVLIGSFLIQISGGHSYTMGNFQPYFISYIKNRTENTGVTNLDTLWNVAIVGATDWSGFLLSGVVERALGPRITVMLFAAVFSGSIAVTYFTVQVSYAFVVFTLGAVNTIAVAGVYGISLQTAIKWFPDRPSFIAGVILSGLGAGALGMNQVITWFINPDNVSPDMETDDGDRYFTDPALLDRVPYCFLLLGGIYMTFTFIGSLAMVVPPTKLQDFDMEVSYTDTVTKKHPLTVSKIVEVTTASDKSTNKTEKETKTDGTSTTKTHSLQDSQRRVQDGDSVKKTLLLILRTRCFWILFFHVLLVMWAFIGIAGLYKAYGQTFISDDHFLALIGTLSSVFNSGGRPIWGLVMDRFGYKVTVRCMSVGLGALFATLFLTEKMPKIGLMVWICLMFFVYSGTWAVMPSAQAKLFGARNISLTFGLLMPGTGIASILVLVTGMTLKATIGWHGMFFLSAAVATLPFFFTFAFNGVDSEGKPI